MIFPLLLPEISIDDYVDRDEECRLGYLIADKKIPSQEDQVYLKEVTRIVSNAIVTLPERERFIIINRFGLSGDDEKTLEEIGKNMNLSRERVRQLEKEAKIKLRELLSSQMAQLRFSLA
ncbi:MAG: sigma-70 family RNA polymerase sigma factor [Acidobacteriota bacterium]